MLPLSSESFLKLGSHHRVDVSLWTAEILRYDLEILKQVSFEFKMVEPVLCKQSIRSLRVGIDEYSVEIWLPCRLPIGGDQRYCHPLSEHLLE